jgi:hypothetical protein
MSAHLEDEVLVVEEDEESIQEKRSIEDEGSSSGSGSARGSVHGNETYPREEE